jgi:hypothetical protein
MRLSEFLLCGALLTLEAYPRMSELPHMVEEVKQCFYNPLRPEDRVEALLSEYTSASGECPYFDESFYSACALDRHSPRFPSCRGRCFTNGLCCDRLLGSPETDFQ